jgi:hypothetical protein
MITIMKIVFKRAKAKAKAEQKQESKSQLRPAPITSMMVPEPGAIIGGKPSK